MDPQTVRVPNDYQVSSQYDADNNRTHITYPDGSVVARAYTERDRLDTVHYTPVGGVAALAADFGYDNGMRRTSRGREISAAWSEMVFAERTRSIWAAHPQQLGDSAADAGEHR
jgi:hypothetical protein